MQPINTVLFDNFGVGDNHPIRLMGVVNLSQESFYQDSYVSKPAFQEKIQAFINNGAEILDIGGRSTAPWSDKISVDEEYKRVVPLLDSFFETLPKNLLISIDTQYAAIARACLEKGKEHGIKIMINDVSSLHTDPDMINVVIEYQCPLIIMASRQIPGDVCTIEEIKGAFQETIQNLENGGYNLDQLIIDPGVGKWIPEKTYEYDLAMLANLEEFRSFGYPILIALSRKSFIGTVLGGKPPEERYFGSLAASAIACYKGAHIIRTHDVNEAMNDTLKISLEIRNAKKRI